MFTAAALRGLWKLRNKLCFQGDASRLGAAALRKLDFNVNLEKLRNLATRPTRLTGYIKWEVTGTR